MLKWFADRLAETGKDARKDERGFTLIELLVVVIIIGILAAIAIPTFLAQQDNAREASAVSDLRNAATAAQSYGTGTGGNFTNLDSAALEANDAELSEGNSWNEGGIGGDGNGFQIAIDGEGGTYSYDSTAEGNNQITTPNDE